MSTSESRKLTVVRAVRMSPDEAAAFDAAAAARGKGPSTFARQVMLRAAKLPVPKSSKRRDVFAGEMAIVLAALARIGNNLNQAVKLANGAKRPVDVEAIDQAKRSLAILHQAVLDRR